MKTGRNDPCPCGSGKKYKHCCLSPASVANFVEMVAGKRSKKPVEKSVDFAICIVRNKVGVK